MKIIMGILASSGDAYVKFKEIIVNHITKFKKSANGVLIDFYFLYSENDVPNYTPEELARRANPRIYFDYYSHVIQTDGLMASFVTRTMSFLNHIRDQDIHYDYFIRTNITTLFDFDALISWLETKPRDYFFAGTLINNIDVSISFSGTNLVMTRDVCLYLIKHHDKLLPDIIEIGDDIAISHVITMGLYPVLKLQNILRVDFVELNQYNTGKIVLYQKCEMLDENIFCFRFKTSDRQFDIDLMKKTSHLINSKNFILSILVKCLNLPFYSENPHLYPLSQNFFTLSTKKTDSVNYI
jgi:hypothetical protein